MAVQKKPEKKPEKKPRKKRTDYSRRKPDVKRTYSDTEKANTLIALEANGGCVRETSRQLGIPEQTIKEWRNGRIHPDIAKISLESRATIADRLEEIAHLLIDDISRPEKIAITPLKEVSIALGISIDKMRLLREQPTSIRSNQDLNPDELVKRVRSLAERIRALPPAVPAITGDSAGNEIPDQSVGKSVISTEPPPIV